jgi:hypothetical protein
MLGTIVGRHVSAICHTRKPLVILRLVGAEDGTRAGRVKVSVLLTPSSLRRRRRSSREIERLVAEFRSSGLRQSGHEMASFGRNRMIAWLVTLTSAIRHFPEKGAVPEKNVNFSLH